MARVHHVKTQSHVGDLGNIFFDLFWVTEFDGTFETSSFGHMIELWSRDRVQVCEKYCIPFETNILDWFPLGTDKKDAIDKRMQIIVAKWARCKNVKIRLIMKKLPFLG